MNEEVITDIGANRQLLKSIQKYGLARLEHNMRHGGLLLRVLEGKIQGKRKRETARETARSHKHLENC